MKKFCLICLIVLAAILIVATVAALTVLIASVFNQVSFYDQFLRWFGEGSGFANFFSKWF